MKTWIITLPLLFAVGVAMAQGVDKEGADQPAAVAAPTEAQVLEKAQAQEEAQAREEMAVQAQDKAQVDKAQADKAHAQAQNKAQAQNRAAKPKPKAKQRQGGDVRHCLNLKTRTEIIRCSEAPRKK